MLEISPNGRSFKVCCKHCYSAFRWKAVHPDTTDVQSAYQNMVSALGSATNRHVVTVPPDKFTDGGGRNLHFDHIVPVAKGGATTIENLQILCAPCNLSKGARI